MKKDTARKGFTTVELVIVIAVIAILATVLIPTFSNLIEKAHHSVSLQEAKGSLEAMLHEYYGELKGGDYYFVFDSSPADENGRTWYKYEGGKIVVCTADGSNGTPKIPTDRLADAAEFWSYSGAIRILDGKLSIADAEMLHTLVYLSQNVEVIRIPTP